MGEYLVLRGGELPLGPLVLNVDQLLKLGLLDVSRIMLEESLR